jgi:hypothetical protein
LEKYSAKDTGITGLLFDSFWYLGRYKFRALEEYEEYFKLDNRVSKLWASEWSE